MLCCWALHNDNDNAVTSLLPRCCCCCRRLCACAVGLLLLLLLWLLGDVFIRNTTVVMIR